MSYPNYPGHGHGHHIGTGLPTPSSGASQPHSQTQLGERGYRRPSTFGGRQAQVQEALREFSPSICTKSSDELFSLLTIESDFEEFFDGIPEVINQKINLKDFQLGNEELARDNLNYRTQLEQLRREVEVKCQSVNQLEKNFQALKEQETTILEKLNPARFLPHLKEERDLVDGESGDLTTSFLSKNLSVEEYINKFRTKRTQFYQYELRLQNIDQRPLPVLDSNGAPVKFLGR